MKKVLSLKSASALFLLGGIWLAANFDYQKFSSENGCAFCKKEVVSGQTVYQGKEVLAILTHKPAVRGHLLVIPKRHVERFEDLSDGELLEIKEMIQKVDRASKNLYESTGYLLVQKNGRLAGQSVPHVHFHYVPRSIGESTLWVAVRFFVTPWLKPAANDEMAAQIAMYLTPVSDEEG